MRKVLTVLFFFFFMFAFGQMCGELSPISCFEEDIAACECPVSQEVISSPLYHSFQDAELPVPPIGSIQAHSCVRLIHSLSPNYFNLLKWCGTRSVSQFVALLNHKRGFTASCPISNYRYACEYFIFTLRRILI